MINSLLGHWQCQIRHHFISLLISIFFCFTMYWLACLSLSLIIITPILNINNVIGHHTLIIISLLHTLRHADNNTEYGQYQYYYAISHLAISLDIITTVAGHQYWYWLVDYRRHFARHYFHYWPLHFWWYQCIIIINTSMSGHHQ